MTENIRSPLGSRSDTENKHMGERDDRRKRGQSSPLAVEGN